MPRVPHPAYNKMIVNPFTNVPGSTGGRDACVPSFLNGSEAKNPRRRQATSVWASAEATQGSSRSAEPAPTGDAIVRLLASRRSPALLSLDVPGFFSQRLLSALQLTRMALVF